MKIVDFGKGISTSMKIGANAGLIAMGALLVAGAIGAIKDAVTGGDADIIDVEIPPTIKS